VYKKMKHTIEILKEKIELFKSNLSDYKSKSYDEYSTRADFIDSFFAALEELFGVSNTKHNEIGYINGLCSEDKRWEVIEIMEKSLSNPKNDLGDE